jgi:hypothetical protein
MKRILHSEITSSRTSGAPLIVLNGLPGWHDVTMTPKQLKALADKLIQLSEAAERGENGESEHEYSASEISDAVDN